jgi:hypothetical protein
MVSLHNPTLSCLIDFNETYRSNNTKIVSKDKTFEVDGANAAREFLQQEGGKTWGKHRIQLVWDAIALHTNSEVNPYKELEVSYTAAGTLTELVGPEIAKQQRVRISFARDSFEPDVAIHLLMSSLGRFHHCHSGRMGHDRGRISESTGNEGLFHRPDSRVLYFETSGNI